jgi:hypothetical protein
MRRTADQPNFECRVDTLACHAPHERQEEHHATCNAPGGCWDCSLAGSPGGWPGVSTTMPCRAPLLPCRAPQPALLAERAVWTYPRGAASVRLLRRRLHWRSAAAAATASTSGAQPCHYQTLGLPRAASRDDVKRAFRRLARQWHPDVNPSSTATERFTVRPPAGLGRRPPRLAPLAAAAEPTGAGCRHNLSLLFCFHCRPSRQHSECCQMTCSGSGMTRRGTGAAAARGAGAAGALAAAGLSSGRQTC